MDTSNHQLIQQLGAAMSEISEECYRAAWLSNTEFLVPELCRRAILSNIPQHWGHGQITPAKAQDLWDLATQIGGWADLHPQDDHYVLHQPFPLPAGIAEDLDHELQQHNAPRIHLFADAQGVWCENRHGHRWGINWDEIYRVSGYTIDSVSEIYIFVELDFVYGEFVEFNDHDPGFDQVVEAITLNLPGIDPNWFSRIRELTKSESLIVWTQILPPVV